MARKWTEIEASKDYQDLAPSEKEEFRDYYFDNVVKPLVPAEEMEYAREAFKERSKPKESEGVVSWLPNSLERGVRNSMQGANVAQVALGINTPEEAARDIAYQRDQIKRIQPTLDVKDQLEEIGKSSGLIDAGKRLVANPSGTIAAVGEGLGGSLGAIGTGVAGGLAGGLAAGPVGATVGMVGGTFGSGLFTEASNSMMDFFERNGVDTSNPEQLTAAFNNPELKMGAYEYGLKRGLPIAVLDAVSAGVGGKFLAGSKGVRSAIARGGAEFGTQAGLGGSGEAIAQQVAGDEYNPSAIALEALAEVPGSSAEIGLGVHRARQRAKFDVPVPGTPILDDDKPEASAQPQPDPSFFNLDDAPIEDFLPPNAPRDPSIASGVTPPPQTPLPALDSGTPSDLEIFAEQNARDMTARGPVPDINLPGYVGSPSVVSQEPAPKPIQQSVPVPVFNEEIKKVLETDEPVQDIIDRTDFPDILPDEMIIGVQDGGEGTDVAGYAYLNQKTGAVRYPGESPPPVTAQPELPQSPADLPALPPTVPPVPSAPPVAAGTRAAPVVVESSNDVAMASSRAASSPMNNLPEPTEAQKEAGNYQKGHLKINGLDVSIETPRGGIRSGTDPDGKPWQVKMPVDYGYIKRTTGADDEQVDVYIGPNPTQNKVYVVDQYNPDTGEFDEHKAFIGFQTPNAAAQAYNAAFSDGKAEYRAGGFSTFTSDEFKNWLKNGDTKKPVKPETKPKPLPTAPTPTQQQGLQKTFSIIDSAVESGDVATLNNVLGNLSNTKSREYFESKTGVKLPRGVTSTRNAIEKWNYDRLETSTKKSTDVLKFEEASAGRKIRIPRAGGDYVYEVVSNDGESVVLRGEDGQDTDPIEATSSGWELISTEGEYADAAPADQPQPSARPKYSVKTAEIAITPSGVQAIPLSEQADDEASQVSAGDATQNTIPALSAPDIAPSTPEPAQDSPPRAQTAAPKPQPESQESALDRSLDTLDQHFYQQIVSGKKYPSIQQARASAAQYTAQPVKPNTAEAKRVDEQLEAAYTRIARDVVQAARDNTPPKQIFNTLVGFYNEQPTLGQRSSTSVENQAYSTPTPISYLASRLAGVSPQSTVLEPTVGHGSLLLEATESNVTAFEIDAARARQFGRMYPSASLNRGGSDFLRIGDTGKRYDVVLSNPPFGRVAMNEPIGSATTSELDQIIVRRALQQMKDDGAAVLIMGSKKGLSRDMENLRDKYNTANARLFFKDLYDNYNVTDHFIASGDLYKKQGAGYPIDIIVIKGRGKSSLPLPGVKAPRLYTSFEQLSELLENGNRQTETEAQPVLYPERDGRELQRVSDDNQTVSGQADTRDVSGLYAGSTERTGQPDERGGLQTGRAGNAVEAQDKRRPRTVGVSSEYGVAGSGDTRLPAESVNRADSAGRDRGDAGYGADSAAGRSEGRTVRVDDGAGRGNNDGVPQPRAVLKPKNRPKVISDSLQTGYTPTSQGKSLDLLIPTNMRDGSEAAVARVDAEVGGVDGYVADKLGYASQKEMQKYFSAEQIDAVALAIRNIESGSALVIADQTGTGKGRINAAVLRYARLQKKIPVFITKDASLMADMYRDLHAIGERDFKALITNTDIVGKEAIETEFGADIRSLPKKKYEPAMEHLRTQGTLPEGFDYLFTSYSQLRPMGKTRTNPRMLLLEKLAPDAIISLDESHEAGGTAASGGWQKKMSPEESKYISTSAFARHLVKIAGGVMYSSATYSKNPSTFSLYSRTGIANAVDDIDKLPEVIAAGGVPLQQAIAAKLVEAGQLLRRERSYDGVTMELVEVESDLDRADRISAALKSIFDFDLSLEKTRKEIVDSLRGAGEARGRDNAIGKEGISSTKFSSIMHNLVGQTLVAQKIESSADRAIEIAKSGKKPLIALTLTNESFIKDFAKAAGYSTGDEVKDLNFNTMLLRFLERTRRLTIKDSEDKATYRQISDDELPSDLVREYKEIYESIRNEDFGNSPISPIDYLHKRLRDAGLKTGELTGREMILNYGADANTATFAKRESSPKIKKKSVRDFNSGELDVLILNQAGATGESMHSSKDFKDQRPRHMLILQPDPNINTYQQMLGRIHRTGQVNLPSYEILISTIPVERRPAAALMKKMASLNANTTANKRGATTISKITDFMNRYGDEVAYDILNEEPGLRSLLDVSPSDDGSIDGMASQITGRMAILPVKEQKRLLDLLESRYRDYIAFLDQRGENALEAKVLDLQAETKGTYDVSPGEADTPFQEPIVVEEVSVKRLGKPYTMQEIDGLVADSLGDRSAAEAARYISQSYLNDTGPEIARITQRLKNLESENGSPEDIQKAKLALTVAERTSANIIEFLQTFRIGGIVTLKSDEGNQHGVILDIRRDASKSPIALSQFTIKIAVDDATREISLPLSKIMVRHGDDKQSRYDLTPSYMNKETLTDLFETKQKDVREKRHIVTGNIIGGVEKFSGNDSSSGKIIFFTRADGEVTQGIMMPQSFKPEKEIARIALPLRDAAEGQKVVDKLGNGRIVTLDGIVSIERDRQNGGYRIAVTRRGRKYYTSKGLTAALGNDLYSRTGDYTQTFDEAKFGAVYSAVKNLGGKWAVNTNQDSVRAWRQDGSSDVRLRVTEPSDDLIARGNPPEKKDISIQAVQRWTKERVEIANKLTKLGKERFGVDLKVGFAEEIRQGGGTATGAYYVRKGEGGTAEYWAVIALGSYSKSPTNSLNHEGIHHLRRVGAIDDQTWAVLEAKAENEWIKKYEIEKNYENAPDWLKVEEAIAEAYADSARWNSWPQKVRVIFNKIKSFIEGVRAILNRSNFTKTDQIFNNISAGKGASAPRVRGTQQAGFKALQKTRANNEGGKEVTEPMSLNISDRGVMDMLSDNSMDFVNRLKKATTREAAMATVDDARRMIQDRFLHAYRVEQLIEETIGRRLEDADRLYTHQQLMTGRIASRLRDITHRYREPMVERISKLNKQYGDGVDRVGRYLTALHAPERNAQIAKINPKFPNDGTAGNSGSGMTDAEAAAIIAAAKRDGSETLLKEVADLTHKMLDEALSARVKYGLIKQEFADKLRETYKYYVPLRGAAEIGDLADGTGTRTGKGLDVRGPETMRAMGRKTPPAEVLAFAFAISEEAVIRGEKNLVLQKLYNLVTKYPSDIWKIAKPKMVGFLNRELGLIEWRPSTKNANMKLDDQTVGVKIDGQQKLIQINDMRIAKPIKNLDITQFNMMMRLVALYQRWFSLANTRLSIDFVLSNFMRDVQTALLNLTGLKLDGVNKKKLATAITKDVWKAMGASWRNSGKGRADPKNEWDGFVRDFEAGGGKVDAFRIDSIDERRGKLMRDIKALDGGAISMTKRGAFAVIEFIERMNDAVESAMRVSVYANLRKMGVSDLDALEIAKNITVNFNKHGELGPQVNALYVFANASIQGTTRILSTLKSRQSRKVVGTLIAMGAMTQMLNQLLSPEDDDGESVYDKVPEWVKQRNLLIVDPTGGQLNKLFSGILPMIEIEGTQYLRIPTAYGWNFFSNVGRNMAAMANGDATAGDAAASVVNAFFQSFNPIGGFDQFDSKGLLSAITPTIADPLVDIVNNRTFSGSKVYKEASEFDASPPPPSAMSFPNTSATSKEFTRILNQITGGDTVIPGAISLSPDVVDYLGAQMLGAAGAFVGSAVDAGVKTAHGEQVFIGDMPIVRVFGGGNRPWQDVAAGYDRMREAKYIQGKVQEYSDLAGKAQLANDPEESKWREKEKELRAKHEHVLALAFEPKGQAKGFMQLTRLGAKSLRDARLSIMSNKTLTREERNKKLEENQAAEEKLFSDFNRRYLDAVRKDKLAAEEN